MDKTKHMIKELFLQALERDKPEKYLTGWDLQDTQETRDNQNFDFKDFKGVSDLEKWFDWCGESEKPCYLPAELISPLKEKSLNTDLEVCHLVGTQREFHLSRIAQENAIDYIIPRMFKKDIYNVLDFGAGYGRQANLNSEIVYVGMDACVNSYCTQNVYYGNLTDTKFIELISDNHRSGMAFHNGIFHIPTWKIDALSDEQFDMVMCVQVLRELSTQLVEKMLKEFHRVLRVGGIIYIRDHDTAWMPCTDISIHDFLLNLGFEVGKTDDPNWKNDIKDGVDLHGVPRVYVKK